jgi:hypothetical protein
MNKQTTQTKEKRPHVPSVTQVAAQLMGVKRRGIYDECRAFEGDDVPGIQVTLGTDLTHKDGWALQTGDNSCAGRDHPRPSRRSRCTNCRELAKELIDQVVEQWWGSQL